MNKELDKAKIGLMQKGAVFWITIAFSMRHEFSEEIPTAATNGKTVKYNPEFFLKLTSQERTGLMMHEVAHVALNHITRRGDKDPIIYNAAGDYVINLLLDQAGFELPKGRLLDYKYHGWSTEQVYDDLYQNAEKIECPMMDIEGTEGTEETEEAENDIREILVKAVTQSRLSQESQGSIPQEILRVVDKLINPQLPWNTVLHQYLQDKIKQDYTWQRPNRRYFPKYILPSAYSESLDQITVAIDTSGSIDDKMLRNILSEIKYIHETLKPKQLTIIDCDCRINHVYEIDESIDIMELEFTGNGGTSFTPVLLHCTQNEPTVLIYFTDLHGSLNQEPPKYPILWVCYSDHKPAPYGDTIYCDYKKAS